MTFSTTFQHHQWPRMLLLLIVALLCGMVAPAMPAGSAEQRIAPQLLELAQTQPSTMVQVIVQKQAPAYPVEAQIERLGGTIVIDLPIIKGFVARMPASSLLELAYNAGIHWISLDSPVESHACSGAGCIDPAKLATTYAQTVGAVNVWNRAIPIRGRGIGVAVVDSGMNPQQDLYNPATGANRIVASVAYNQGWNQSVYDMYGHGNHVAAIIGGNGSRSQGAYVGIAPEVNLINVKISDDLNQGVATTSSVVAGLQWIYNNRTTYNIRVVSISLTDSIVESYKVSALAAAVELLWFNKIVVVVSAGNSGSARIAAPANDPFVITVGAINDKGTASVSDDQFATWSSYGRTVDGFAKPDVVAPGVNIIAPMPVPNSALASRYPGNVIRGSSGDLYFRMSGTSVSAPIVAGAAALLLQASPSLTPDQVKHRLMSTALPICASTYCGSGLVQIHRAIDSTSTASANSGIAVSHILTNGQNQLWSSANWSTANWSTANWSTANWSTANWSTANWSTMFP